MSNNFEVQQGNGRLFPLDADKKSREMNRLKDLREKGQSWATDDKCHNYDGFLQVGQSLIDWLQQSFDQQTEETMRMNWKGFVGEGATVGKFLKIQDVWIAKQPSLKQFVNGVGSSAPTATAPIAKDAEVTFSDDIPF